jgi:hypothetical protein
MLEAMGVVRLISLHGMGDEQVVEEYDSPA